ncbi:MAG: Bax inhibitor-1/YccA family protein [Propionibacteriaceae bacterium]|nr:Bax inhibitor-1/YccA family protein [Propionibacteriaceae bacterium]
MANPVFSSSSTFNRPPTYQQPYDYQQPGYQQPGYPPQPGYQGMPAQPAGGVMTLDDVLAKTAIALLVVFGAAAATFLLVPTQLASGVMIAGAIGGFIAALVVSMRHTISVGGVIIYAVLEGLFVGALSKFFEVMWPGIVVSAVLATFVTAGATLAAYKFFNIRVTAKFRKMVVIATMSLAGVMLVNLVLALLGVNTGLREIGSGAGLLSIGVSILAVCLAVFNLVIDFDFVERGIAAQAPAQESWRAAFGITVTMVWLYIEILRILSYFRD